MIWPDGNIGQGETEISTQGTTDSSLCQMCVTISGSHWRYVYKIIIIIININTYYYVSSESDNHVITITTELKEI